MRHDLYIVCFAPVGDFTRLGKTADDTEIDSRVVEQFFFDHLAEFPLGGIVLAYGERNADVLTHLAIALGVFAAQRILDKEGVVLLEFAAETDGVRWIETGVDVDTELYFWSYGFARGGEMGDGVADRGARIPSRSKTDIRRYFQPSATRS